MVQNGATQLSGLSEAKPNNSGIVKRKIFEKVII